MQLRAFFLPVFFFLCFLLAGCDGTTLLNQLASTDEQAYARSLVERLRARDFDAVQQALDKSLVDPELRATLENMAGMVPAGTPRSVQIVGAQKHYQNGVTTLHATYEYEFAQGWLLAQVSIAEKDGRRAVTSFRVEPRSQSLAEENAFSLAGKGLVHYLTLVLAVAAALLSIAALVVCVRMRPLRRKWIWIAFIVFGFCKFTLNWNTGVLLFQPLSLLLFSASAIAPLGAPWTVSYAIPLGAIVFLVYANKRQTEKA